MDVLVILGLFCIVLIIISIILSTIVWCRTVEFYKKLDTKVPGHIKAEHTKLAISFIVPPFGGLAYIIFLLCT